MMYKKIIAIVLIFSFVTKSEAITDGVLDGSFGMNGTGIVTTPIGSGYEEALALIIQPDGKLVAAGYVFHGLNEDFALVRYNPDGTLDSSFGSGGKVTTSIGSGNDRALALIIQPDGKLVAAGFANTDFALVRYNADGTLDSSFGSGGKVTTPIGSGTDIAQALIIQPDGKLVVAGYSNNGLNFDFALARYNTDGSLDSSFGSGGKVTTAIGSGDDFVSALILQPDGKLVAAGYSKNGSNFNFALARYNPDGVLDILFGSGGKVTTSIGSGSDYAYALIIQPDGKLVVAGGSYNGTNYDFALVRYNPNGFLDSSFGSGGKVTTAIGSDDDDANALIIQPDGKLVVAGYSNNGLNFDFALARYNTDGSLDSSFGSGGKVTTSIGSGDDYASALILQPDGKLVAAGFAYNGLNNDFALARYLISSLEISSVARDIRAKYRPLIPSDRNGTEYGV